jgi:hypothetical protein
MTVTPKPPKKPATTHPARPDHSLDIVALDEAISKRFSKVLAALAKK